jgi:hypothetical protein
MPSSRRRAARPWAVSSRTASWANTQNRPWQYATTSTPPGSSAVTVPPCDVAAVTVLRCGSRGVVLRLGRLCHRRVGAGAGRRGAGGALHHRARPGGGVAGRDAGVVRRAASHRTRTRVPLCGADSKQTLLCAYLSAVLLVGLAVNSLFVGGGPTRSRRSSSRLSRSKKAARPGAATSAAHRPQRSSHRRLPTPATDAPTSAAPPPVRRPSLHSGPCPWRRRRSRRTRGADVRHARRRPRRRPAGVTCRRVGG